MQYDFICYCHSHLLLSAIWYYVLSSFKIRYHLLLSASICYHQLWCAIICPLLFAVIRHDRLLSATIWKCLASSATFLLPCTICWFSIIWWYQLLSIAICYYLLTVWCYLQLISAIFHDLLLSAVVCHWLLLPLLLRLLLSSPICDYLLLSTIILYYSL